MNRWANTVLCVVGALAVASCAFAEVAGAAPVAASGPTVTRDQIVARAQSNIRLDVGDRPLWVDVAGRDAFLARLRAQVQSVARKVLPSVLSTRDAVTWDRILRAELSIPEDVPEHNALRIERWLRDVKLSAAMALLVTLPAGQDREALDACVNAVWDGVEAAMQQRLREDFAPAELAEHVESMRQGCLEKMDDPLTYWFKVPAADGAVEALLAEFDVRLDESMESAKVRLGLAAKLSEDPTRAEEARSLRNGVLLEITSWALSMLGDATTDQELAAVDVESIEPGYTELVIRLDEIEASRMLADVPMDTADAE